MNIYLISQKDNIEHDTYSSAVVVAESERQAQEVHPAAKYVWLQGKWYFKHSSGDTAPYGKTTGCWTSPDKVTVKLIGEAYGYEEPQVILAKMNHY